MDKIKPAGIAVIAEARMKLCDVLNNLPVTHRYWEEIDEIVATLEMIINENKSND